MTIIQNTYTHVADVLGPNGGVKVTRIERGSTALVVFTSSNSCTLGAVLMTVQTHIDTMPHYDDSFAAGTFKVEAAL